MQVQYNFKIDESLKEAVEQALNQSDVSNKSDFLAQMLSAYTAHNASNTPSDIDFTKYENVNQQTKDSVTNAFKHILTTLDANFSTTTHEVLRLDTAQKALETKELAYQSELEKLTADTIAQVNATKIEADKKVNEMKTLLDAVSKENLELQTINTRTKEQLHATSQLATQVQFIAEENKELRESAKTLKESAKNQEHQAVTTIKGLEENSFKQDFALKHQEKEYQSLQNRLDEAQKDADIAINAHKDEIIALNRLISSSQAELNQAIGRLEILNAKNAI